MYHWEQATIVALPFLQYLKAQAGELVLAIITQLFFNGTSFEGSEKGLEALTRIMDVVGVAKWEDIKGHYVRVKQENRLVVGIGNIIEDKWFEPREFFKEIENE